MAKHGICLNGMLFPAIADPEWIPQIPDYPVSPGDLYVVTYPKSGTTCMGSTNYGTRSDSVEEGRRTSISLILFAFWNVQEKKLVM